MKKINLFLIISLVVLSCTQNKSVIEQLKANQISKLIHKDPLYEDVINEIETIRGRFEDDLVLQSKFIDLTYSEFHMYYKTVTDTSYLFKVVRKARKDYADYSNNLMNKYKPIIDEKIVNYRDLKNKNNPSKFFTVEYVGIEKKYFTYGYDDIKKVGDIYVLFKITSLGEGIQGGSFSYEFIPKTKQKIKIGSNSYNKYYKQSGSYKFSNSISKPTIVKDTTTSLASSWGVIVTPWGIEEMTSKIIKQEFNFEYEISSVTVNNNTYFNDYREAPLCFRYNIDQDSLTVSEYEYIITEHYDIVVMQIEDFFLKIDKEKKMKLNTLAYDLELLIEINKY